MSLLIEDYLDHIEEEVSKIEGTDEEMREQLLKLAARILADIKYYLNNYCIT